MPIRYVMLQAQQPEVFLGKQTIIASSAMNDVMRLVHRVAQTNASVLIRGETGTGKEHVARAIHHYSLRHAKPWVDVNCGSLPEHLMESELFGYERGAFSGADSVKLGLFEMAHTGTIFLDEVAELSPAMQVKLLRVLDGTPYFRLGGVKKVAVDVRVVAATNRDLEEATRQGDLRRDLYYRLNEFSIRVPPLRERPEDIVPLAEFFLHQSSDQALFSQEAQALLRGWKWEGNVRELRNVVTTAAVLSETYEIGPACLPAEMREPGMVTGLDGVERRAILDALNTTDGHQQRAADMLRYFTPYPEPQVEALSRGRRGTAMSVLRESPADRRQHERQLANGPITLWWADCSPRKIQGRLMDISETGLRIAHACIALGPGQQVRFQHAGGDGIARTIWTRIVGDRAESGLLILPEAAWHPGAAPN